MHKILLDKAKNQLQVVKKRPHRIVAICLVSLSIIFFLTMLIGSSVGSVDLNKFTFDDTISKIINRKSIKFTLLGYCIDDKCTKDVSHNFDKAPSSDEIQSGEVVNKRSIGDPKYDHIDIGDVADAGKDVGEQAGEIGKDVGEQAGEIGKDIGNKAGEAIDDVSKAAVNALLTAFDSFVPKEPTNGKSGWIARPIITAAIFNTLVVILLFITNDENKKYFYPPAFILLFISLILNAASFFITFSLFSLVFNVIGAFPGIGDNRTGAAIYLSGWSASLLFIALILMLIDCTKRKAKNSKEEKPEEKPKEKPQEENV